MRLLTSLLLVSLFIVSSSLYINTRIAQSADQIAVEIDSVSRAIQEDDWTEAFEGFKKMESEWNRSKQWWPIIIDHREIDNIEFTLSKTTSYVQNKNKDLSLGELSALKEMVAHIPRKEAINFKNIL